MALRVFGPDHEWIARIHAEIQVYAKVQRRMPLRAEPLEVPTRRMLAELLEVAFWASLTTNEGRPTRVRMAMARTGSLDSVLAFRDPVPYREEEIARLAPAAASTGWLAVDSHQVPSSIWGISRQPISDRLGAIIVDVSDPGIVRVGMGPFQSFVVFAGRSTTSPRATRDLALTARLRAALGKELVTGDIAAASIAWRECEALTMLARMVLEDRHGGTLLVVPESTGAWLASLDPFTHQFLEPDRSVRASFLSTQHSATSEPALARLEQADLSDSFRSAMFSAIAQASSHPEGLLRPIARLAAIDGAVVLTSDLDVLGFGAMIKVEAVPEVYLASALPEQVDRIRIEDVGGTRHQSAVRFVGQHRESVALVISHDGHLSLAHWSRELDAVQVLKNAEWWI
jgi:hypothetical protein